MNYYLALKEEKSIKLIAVSMNAKEILLRLDEIENKVGIENILPFYDELIEVIRMGLKIEIKDVDTYYKLYSSTFAYSGIKLSNAIRNLVIPFKDFSEELYEYLP